jgi:methyltransferase (TIGR00027 family)
MREDSPSLTALFVAYARAVADREPELRRACQDPIAARILPRPYSTLIRFAERSRSPERRYRELRVSSLGLVDHVALRSGMIDRGLTRALDAGTRQVVLLGAGLDARAHRLRALRDATVFEVDHPSTQELKLRKAAGLPVLARDLRYAPCDFERVSLSEALLAQGFSPQDPVVWIWEGVTMYLDERAVEGSLGLISQLSASGSQLIASYVTPKLTATAHPSAELGLWALAFLAEPIRSPFKPDDMARRLARHDFEVLDDALPADVAAEFGVEKPLRWWGMPDEHIVIARKR